MRQILEALGKTQGLCINDILARVNITRGMLEKALKLLEVDGAIGTTFENRKTIYFCTPNPWHPDVQRYENVTHQRQVEKEQMKSYSSHTGCLMRFLQVALDDALALQAELAKGAERFFQFGLYITIPAETLEELNQKTKEVDSVLSSL